MKRDTAATGKLSRMGRFLKIPSQVLRKAVAMPDVHGKEMEYYVGNRAPVATPIPMRFAALNRPLG